MKLFRNKKHKKRHYDTLEQILNADSPFAYAESYKALRTNLNFLSWDHQYKTILVTSALPAEGKSSLCMNLAISLIENGSKYLIDCDLRKPILHRYAGLPQPPQEGLSAILSGNATLENAIHTHPAYALDILLSGPIPPNPAELLGSSNMHKLLSELEERYDYIICDTPPASIVTDAAALSRYCDGAVLVIKQNYASFSQVQATIHSLEAVGVNLLGTVLTQYDSKIDAKEGESYYYSYYNDYEYSNSHKKDCI